MGYIIIGADFVPTQSNVSLFNNASVEQLFNQELIELLQNADYRIFNLEFPLTDIISPIQKCGTNFSSPTDAVALYKRINVDLFCLANNHILDQGMQGLNSTFLTLEKNNISYTGAGKTIEESKRPFYFENCNTKYGVYCIAENEFSVANETHGGANPLNILDIKDEIRSSKRECEFLIVLYHGGKEEYRYPSPHLQILCRKLVEAGADLIICQHSHCIGCYEQVNNSTIIYGQGNFLFDDEDNEYWNTSLLIKICGTEVSTIPIVKNGNGVNLANDLERKKIIDDFENRSTCIKDRFFINEMYRKKSLEMLNNYLISFSGNTRKNIFFRLLNKISKGAFYRMYIKMKYNKQALVNIKNIVECEAHKEMLICGINERTNL